MSIAVDLRRVPDRLKTNRQRAPRQMWNDVERPLHVLANLVIAVGFVPGFLDGEWSGAPAAVRHDRVRAHESAARGRIDGVSLGHAQGKQNATCGGSARGAPPFAGIRVEAAGRVWMPCAREGQRPLETENARGSARARDRHRRPRRLLAAWGASAPRARSGGAG